MFVVFIIRFKRWLGQYPSFSYILVDQTHQEVWDRNMGERRDGDKYWCQMDKGKGEEGG
jgi:hypothetical protein